MNMAQTRPNAVQISGVLLTVADTTEPPAEQKRASLDSGVTTADHPGHNLPRMSAPPGAIKSAMKRRDLRTPSPAPHDGACACYPSGSTSPVDGVSVTSLADLQSPFEDADYIRRFLSSANRHSVRFGEDSPHENNIDVHLDDNETISVHVGYLQLECVYTVEFAIPADLLYQARGGKPADVDEPNVNVNANVAQFLHGWRVERVLGKQAKLIRSSVNEQTSALQFEFEFRAMKEKIVAQRFIIAYGEPQPENPTPCETAEGDSVFKLNVVLVCRVFPRVKGTALLREGVHMISHSHGRRTSCSPDATDTSAPAASAADGTVNPDNLKPSADHD